MNRTTILAALLLAACATDPNKMVTGPYAFVSGHAGAAAPFDTSSVIVIAIDGVEYFDDDEERRLAPGPHTIVVATTRGRTRFDRHSRAPTEGPHDFTNPRAEWRSDPLHSTVASTGPSDKPWVSLTAEPCMRYYVIAHHTSGAIDAPWTAELTASEPIEGCHA